MYVVDNNSRDICTLVHIIDQVKLGPQQPRKQILHKATHFVGVDRAPQVGSWEINEKMVFLFLLSWTLIEDSTDSKISNLKT